MNVESIDYGPTTFIQMVNYYKKKKEKKKRLLNGSVI